MSKSHAMWIVFLVAIFPCAPTTAFAGWSTNGVAVCTQVDDQNWPEMCTDGAGGAIIAWTDLRNENEDIYAQHILASGGIDPSWPANGLRVCGAPGTQRLIDICSDGSGGAIITWEDFRLSLGGHIYAHRVLGSGMVDPAWPINGRVLCNASGFRSGGACASDGAGGAIVTWGDRRNLPTGFDIYAHHVLGSGEVDSNWPANGLALCTATNDQLYPQIVSDGAGGAIVTWGDRRRSSPTSFSWDIYAHRVLSSGIVDPAWPVNGLAVCTAGGVRELSDAVTDGAGGAIVTWSDGRSTSRDVFAQRVLLSGAVDPSWPVNGRALCTANGDQGNIVATADGAGGAIVAWEDPRDVANNIIGIFAQRVLSSGAVDPNWPANGRNLSNALTRRISVVPRIASDDAGGAFVAWQDNVGVAPAGDNQLFVQHVLATGTLDESFLSHGEMLCDAVGVLRYMGTMVSDGSGGALVAWHDGRNGNLDVYAQHVLWEQRVGVLSPAYPPGWRLSPVFPNPARSIAAVRVTLTPEARFSAAVYDLAGRKVRSLVEREAWSSERVVSWDGTNDKGIGEPSGLYFLRVDTQGHTMVRRFALVR